MTKANENAMPEVLREYAGSITHLSKESRKIYLRKLMLFREYLSSQEKDLTDFTPKEAAGFIEHYETHGHKGQSIKNARASIGGFVKWLHARGGLNEAEYLRMLDALGCRKPSKLKSLSPLLKEYREYIGQLSGSTRQNRLYYLKNLEGYFEEKGKRLTELTPQDINEYLNRCKNRGNSRDTIFNKVVSTRAFFEWLREVGKLDEQTYRLLDGCLKRYSPSRGLADVEALTKEEINKIHRETPNDVFRIIFWFMTNFGLRLQEVCNMKIRDIDLDKREVKVQTHPEDKWEPKCYRKREIPITSNQALMLKKWINTYRDMLVSGEHDYVFCSITGKKLRRWTLKYILKKIENKTEIKVYAQRLRYTYAVTLWRNGLDISTISNMLGHARIETTQRYLRVPQREFRQRYLEHAERFF